MQVEVGLASLGGEPRAVLLREVTALIRRPPAPATLLIALESLNFVVDSVARSQSTIETRCNFHTVPCSVLVAAVHLCLRHLHPDVVLVDLLELMLGVQSPQHLADAVLLGITGIRRPVLWKIHSLLPTIIPSFLLWCFISHLELSASGWFRIHDSLTLPRPLQATTLTPLFWAFLLVALQVLNVALAGARHLLRRRSGSVVALRLGPI